MKIGDKEYKDRLEKFLKEEKERTGFKASSMIESLSWWTTKRKEFKKMMLESRCIDSVSSKSE